MEEKVSSKHFTIIEKKTPLSYSKNEYVKLGDRLREYDLQNETLPIDDLEMLQTLRTSYKAPLSEVFNVLQKSIRSLNKGSIVTYRVKRIDSIISKLKRLPDTQLPRIEDIAGCRCILKNNDQVYKLKAILEKELFVKSDRNDYIKNPKPDGYKSLHLIVQTKDRQSRPIEVQIRCEKDHNWATLVEITDLVYTTRIKELGDSSELGRMLYLLSKGFQNLVNDELMELIHLIDKSNFTRRINSVFVNNSINVRKQWSEIERKSDRNFYLIQVDKQNNSFISSYHNFNEAEKAYFNIFKNNQDHNIVLTHIPNAKFEQISKAYSNYTLTYHDFFHDLLSKLQELVRISFAEGNIQNFIKHFTLFAFIYFEMATLQTNEMFAMLKTKCKRAKKDEWERDIKINFNKIIKKGQDHFSEIKVNRLNVFHLIIDFNRRRIWKRYSNIYMEGAKRLSEDM